MKNRIERFLCVIIPGLQTKSFLRLTFSSMMILTWMTTASAGLPPVTSEVYIQDTAYQIPSSNAYYVSPAGNDLNNNGSLSKPWFSLAKAVSLAPSGSTIVMREGAYRETVSFNNKKLTIQPYPHEKVWIKGSMVIPQGDFVQESGGLWRKDNWTYAFDHAAVHPKAIDPAYPLAGYPEMVFVDGVSQKQVIDKAGVVPGSFCVDTNNDKLYLGTDPAGKTIEVSIYTKGITVGSGADGSIIRGLGFMHYATVYQQGAAVYSTASDFIFEKNTVAWNAILGMSVNAGSENPIVRSNIFIYNGMNGFSSYKSDGLLLEKNIFSFNNVERFHPSWSSAGTKMATIQNAVIQDNVSEYNYQSSGIWCDISSYNVKMIRNLSRHNGHHGIFYEISTQGLIASNLLLENGFYGIKVGTGSNHVKVYNNTMVANYINLAVLEDSRTNDNLSEIAMGNTWESGATIVKNNIFSNGDGGVNNPMYRVIDYTTNDVPIKTGNQIVTASDYNAYYRSTNSAPKNLAAWQMAEGTVTLLLSLAQFKLQTGYGTNSFEIVNMAANPFFMNESTGDYRLKTDSQAKGAGEPLPLDVAQALGMADGMPIDMGAIQWPGSDQTASGIPISWLQLHGLATDGSVDQQYLFGSAYTVWEHWRAGTDPNDRDTDLRLTGALVKPLQGFAIRWRSVATRTYRIEYSSDLHTAMAFCQLEGAVNIQGVDGILEYVDTSTTGAGPIFYRVVVE